MPQIASLVTQPELLSDEMNDFIGNRPHWIIRRGNSIFLLLLLALAAISWLIEYPDIITAPMQIIAVNAPKLLTAKTDGKLEQLLVANEDQVHAGQQLAFLQSTGNHRQVLALYGWIESIEPDILKNKLEVLLHNRPPSTNALGEVQPAYEAFENARAETQQVLASGFYQKKKQALQQDLAYMQDVEQTLLKQKSLTEQNVALQQIEYNAKEALAKDKVIATLEFNQDKSKLLDKQQTTEQFNAQIINNKIATHNKQKEVLELQKFLSDQEWKFRTALFNLKSKLQDWIRQYVVTATTDGKVSFVSFLQENQYIQNNQQLFYIVPASNQFYGQLRAGQSGIGKIKQGQKVIIRVNSFPSNEFGYLSGKVSYIPSMIENDSSLLIKVDFTNGLQTNYGKQLLFKSNMNASAEIITDNRRLPERLLGQLREILRR
jgi:HlyD family secretion protein